MGDKRKTGLGPVSGLVSKALQQTLDRQAEEGGTPPSREDLVEMRDRFGLTIPPAFASLLEGRSVVLNRCRGGFNLSAQAVDRLADLGVKVAPDLRILDDQWQRLPRHDHRLVRVVNELRGEASDTVSDLRVIALKGDEYIVMEREGLEWVIERNSGNWRHVDDGPEEF